ncbi:MAG: SDR family NAD(P)-dependent oxidoreductase [Spirochaetaceae bacterium]|jgi:short-subunit dehydrogenase|nr:SDR family NAD(P)-dependent oxidoreductase [Spirochaetaceae bacterium]
MLKKYGPYALVAGGSDGLGAAFSRELAKRGFNLVILARRKEKLEALAQDLAGRYHVRVIPHAADAGDFASVKAFVEGLDAEIGLLVYNAAFAPVGPFTEISGDSLSQAVAVNVRGPLLLARLLAPGMIERKRGGIVLMSSLAGTQGSPRLSVYAATKAFNTVLAEGLWEELRPFGIDVTASCPGAILTPGYERTQSAGAPGTLTAEAVAEATLNALGKGPVCVPGLVNKLARFFMMRLMPRKGAIKIMAANTRSLS